MTQGDKHPEKFTKGQRLTAAGLNGLTEAIQSVMSRMIGQQVVRPLNSQAILQSDLLAAVNTLTDRSTALAEVLQRKTNGDLETTGRVVTVVNPFQEISIDAGTYIKIEWIDGEWQPYAADCPAQSASMSMSMSGSASESASNPPPPPGGP